MTVILEGEVAEIRANISERTHVEEDVEEVTLELHIFDIRFRTNQKLLSIRNIQ